MDITMNIIGTDYQYLEWTELTNKRVTCMVFEGIK
jgi:hypothetical protein